MRRAGRGEEPAAVERGEEPAAVERGGRKGGVRSGAARAAKLSDEVRGVGTEGRSGAMGEAGGLKPESFGADFVIRRRHAHRGRTSDGRGDDLPAASIRRKHVHGRAYHGAKSRIA